MKVIGMNIDDLSLFTKKNNHVILATGEKCFDYFTMICSLVSLRKCVIYFVLISSLHFLN